MRLACFLLLIIPTTALALPDRASDGGWTVDTLYQHLTEVIEANDKRYDQRFDAQNEAVKNALASADRAVMKAEAATEKRFESVNEFRKTLSDQTQGFITKPQFDATEEKLNVLIRRFDERESRDAGSTSTWAYVVAGIGMALGIGGFVLGLRNRRTQGK